MPKCLRLFETLRNVAEQNHKRKRQQPTPITVISYLIVCLRLSNMKPAHDQAVSEPARLLGTGRPCCDADFYDAGFCDDNCYSTNFYDNCYDFVCYGECPHTYALMNVLMNIMTKRVYL